VGAERGGAPLPDGVTARAAEPESGTPSPQSRARTSSLPRRSRGSSLAEAARLAELAMEAPVTAERIQAELEGPAPDGIKIRVSEVACLAPLCCRRKSPWTAVAWRGQSMCEKLGSVPEHLRAPVWHAMLQVGNAG
jgi:hypothetical protein